MSVANIPTRTTLQINYADPAGIGNVVTGTESVTAISQFDLKNANMILDGNATTLPAAPGDGILSIQRLNGLTTQVATLISLQPTNQALNKGGLFPKGMNNGQLQFILEETVALALGINIRWTFARPLQ